MPNRTSKRDPPLGMDWRSVHVREGQAAVNAMKQDQQPQRISTRGMSTLSTDKQCHNAIRNGLMTLGLCKVKVEKSARSHVFGYV